MTAKERFYLFEFEKFSDRKTRLQIKIPQSLNLHVWTLEYQRLEK